MRTKNAKAISMDERHYLGWIKQQPCAVCGASEPSDAHHIDQGKHFLVIPLCRDCHQGSFNGIHGQRRIWHASKKSEMSCLNETIQALVKCGLVAVK